MDLKDALRNGMRVVGPDDREYGTIDRYDDAAVYVRGQRVPFAAIDRLERDRLYLHMPELWHLTESDRDRSTDLRTGGATDPGIDGAGTGAAGLGGEIRVPLVEEQLEVKTGLVDLGEIRIHKTVEENEEVHRGTLDREDVQIERIRVDRPVTAPEQRRQEGDWLVIPIMEEVFVVQKQLVVREEIRIRKQLVTEEHEVRETVRRERATVEDTRAAPRAAAPARAAAGTAAGRGDDAAGRPDDDAAWQALHEELREADR